MRLLMCNGTSSTLVWYVVSAEIASVGNVRGVGYQDLRGQRVGREVKSKTTLSVSCLRLTVFVSFERNIPLWGPESPRKRWLSILRSTVSVAHSVRYE